jgi:hypothetical protein
MSNNEWTKPQTVFAAFFYFTFLLMISCGNPVPLLLERVVWGMMVFFYGNKLFKNVMKGKEK